MRNRNFTAHLRTRKPSIHLDASQNRLGFKIHDRKKAKGEQADLANRLFPYVEEMGGRPGNGTGLVPPKRRRWRERPGNGTGLVPPKSTIQIV